MDQEIQRVLRKIKVAYCAGLVDGEGCLFVHTGRTKTKNREYNSTQIHLIVGMANKAPLDFLAETFGGEVKPLEKQGKLHFRWVLCSHKAVEAVKEMLPFLQGKKEQADLFILFYELWRMIAYKHNQDRSLLHLIEAKIKEMRKVSSYETYLPATTEREDSFLRRGCDSLNSSGNEPGELAEMTNRLNLN